MKRKSVLIVDATINLILGIMLLVYPFTGIGAWLGVPLTDQPFYASILGAVFIGITIALLVEALRGPDGLVGLGLGGAISINLCSGLVLTLWLIFGKLALPVRGLIFLWGLAVILVIISGAELVIHLLRQ